MFVRTLHLDAVFYTASIRSECFREAKGTVAPVEGKKAWLPNRPSDQARSHIF
jgi:hypothetical protein